MTKQTNTNKPTGLAWLVVVGSVVCVGAAVVVRMGLAEAGILALSVCWMAALVWGLSRLCDSFIEYNRRRSEKLLEDYRRPKQPSAFADRRAE